MSCRTRIRSPPAFFRRCKESDNLPTMKRLLTWIVVLLWLFILGAYAREPFEAWFSSRNFDLAEWNEAKEQATRREIRQKVLSDPELRERLAAVQACSALASPNREKC